MSYNTAENYPLPYSFNDGDVGANYVREREDKVLSKEHPLYNLKVGESYCYAQEGGKAIAHVLLYLRKIGRKFSNDRQNQTYTRVV